MSDKEWFREWFDSPYYHLLYANRSQQEAELFIRRVVEKLNIPENSTILDAACGKGRHSRTLAKIGFDVTGIDISPHNIEFAKKFEAQNLHFELWDIRKVYRPGHFDYVFNIFSSFGYFDNDADDLQAVRAFAGELKAGGMLLMDYMNSESTVKNLQAKKIIPREGVQFHIQKKVEDNFIKKKIEFLAAGQHYSFEEHLKLLNLHRFETMFKEAGLEMKATYGDYDLNPFNHSSSERLIMVATKV